MTELSLRISSNSLYAADKSKSGTKTKKPRTNRTADYHLKKMDILSGLAYTEGNCGVPVIKSTDFDSIPNSIIAFSKAISSTEFEQIVHFYEADRSFARIMHNPQKYAAILSRFKYVISPDFSQHLDMPPFLCRQNSWWNNAFGAYWQSMGINVIPNVSWSRPESYEYAFNGIPKHGVVAINCTAIKGNPMSRYFWMKGYDAAIGILNPKLIIRYVDKMPNEDEERSIYFENENLKRLRNGR